MSETVLLTARCQRAMHLMFRVVETPDAVMIEALRYCAGRESETWTPMRRRLDPANGRVSRYGCQCRRCALIGDREIWARIHDGYSRWAVAASNISVR